MGDRSTSRERAPEPASAARRTLRRSGRVLATLGMGAALVLAAVMLVPAALGYERYVITGDSMTGSYDRGSLVYEREVPVSELAVGDVITYQPPRARAPEGLVTHRIISIGEGRRGEPVFRTKGDANTSADPWRFSLDGPTQARAVFEAPYVGYAFAALARREVRMFVIGAPALLIALVLVTRLWRQAGEEVAARRAAAAAADGQ